MNVLFAQGLTDDEFLHRYTVGHEELREHVKTYTPERVSRITGVPEADIIRLAEMYGTARAAYINIGNGLQHHDNGGMNVRAVTCLPALTGQWLKHGGGASRSNGAYAKINSAHLERPDLRQNPDARMINMNRIGEALLQKEQPIKALFVYCSNPVVVAPDSERVTKGFEREDLFTVVHDLFLTDTAAMQILCCLPRLLLKEQIYTNRTGTTISKCSSPSLIRLGKAKAIMSCLACSDGQWALMKLPLRKVKRR